MTIIHNPTTNTIILSNEITNISSINSFLSNANIIQELTPKNYLLNANLLVESTSTLNITNIDVDYLKINNTNNIIHNINNKGILLIDNVEISSWNTYTNMPEQSIPIAWNTSKPRSYIIAAEGDQSHANVTYSKIHHLGYEPIGLPTNGLGDGRYRGLTWVSSNDNYITHNNFSDDMYTGIMLWEKSSNNTIQNNTIYNTREDGILAYHFNKYNLIENNTIINAGINGIELFSNNQYNIIKNNNVSNTKGYGIYQQSANSYNNVIDNNINNTLGLKVYQSGWSTIENNTIDVSSQFGLVISFSEGNIIKNNIIKNSNMYGIIIVVGNDNLIEKNKIQKTNSTSWQGDGICVMSEYRGTQWYDSINNKLINNIIINCAQSGIKIYHGINTNILNNTICNNNENGILCEENTGLTNIIKNNIITNNKMYGIKGTDIQHNYNDIWNNTLGSFDLDNYNVNELTVDPLFADIINNDFHLKSQYGRWNGTTWLNDTETSPCIQAGDPTSDNSLSPWQSSIIEIGAYGNTLESSNYRCLTPICNINIKLI